MGGKGAQGTLAAAAEDVEEIKKAPRFLNTQFELH